MQDPAIVLLNPVAGQGRAAALRRPIEQWLAKRMPQVPLLAPSSADAALATLMVIAPRTRVVVVGGDGSVQAMLPAFLRCGHRLGLLPAGTNNHLARALGVHGVGWPKALAYALKAAVAPLDIGQVQTEDDTAHFVASLHAGFDAQVAARLQRAPRLLRGLPRRLWTVPAAWLQHAPTEARIWVNGELEYEGRLSSANVLNAPTPGTSLPAHAIAAEPRFDDGRLDALVVPALGLWSVLRLLAGHPAHPASLYQLCGQKLVIDAGRPLALAADGDPLAPASRLTVQVLPRALYAAGRHAARPRRSSASATTLPPLR
ncbi:MAG: diacylglycerol kinase family protein [Burkholderiales bacterium]